jgi:hypothetical protein
MTSAQLTSRPTRFIALLAFLLAAGALVSRVRAGSCQVVDPYQFMVLAAPPSEAFVITPEKLDYAGVDGFRRRGSFSIREDVVFDKTHWPDNPAYVGSRGYEFRYELTPHNNADPYQEIHTTISAYRGELGGGRPFPGMRCAQFLGLQQSGDDAGSHSLNFLLGNYSVNIKTKYLPAARAVPLLEAAAQIVYYELLILEVQK